MKKNRTLLQQHRLLREASQLLTIAEKLKTEKPETKHKTSKHAANATSLLTRNVKEFLTSRYDFRYNLLTDETEFRPAGQRTVPFTPIGKRELNALCIEAHDEGIPCWDKDLSRYVYSSYIASYHPFHLYMDELPAWDLPYAFPAVRCGYKASTHGCWGLLRNGWISPFCMPIAWRPFSSAGSRGVGRVPFAAH